MTCEKCGCCEAYVCSAGTPDEEQWKFCLWCADGVPCPNAARKAKQAAAQKIAADVAPPRHDHGVMHFASASKRSREGKTVVTQYARPIPTNQPEGEVMSNTIEELRADLFETLRSLKGKVEPIEIQRAKAICDVAGKIIDTGKLELAAAKKVGHQPSSRFFADTAQPEHPQLTNGKPS